MNYKPLQDLIPLDELSDHPGEALLQAVHDLKIAIKRKDVFVDMDVYLQTKNDGKYCNVCLAGSTLLNDYYFNNISIKKNFCLDPQEFYKTKGFCSLRAIDYFRTGCIAKGLIWFFVNQTPKKHLSDFYKEIESYFIKNYYSLSDWTFSVTTVPASHFFFNKIEKMDKFLKQMTDLGEYLLSFPLEYLNGECKFED